MPIDGPRAAEPAFHPLFSNLRGYRTVKVGVYNVARRVPMGERTVGVAYVFNTDTVIGDRAVDVTGLVVVVFFH